MKKIIKALQDPTIQNVVIKMTERMPPNSFLFAIQYPFGGVKFRVTDDPRAFRRRNWIFKKAYIAGQPLTTQEEVRMVGKLVKIRHNMTKRTKKYGKL